MRFTVVFITSVVFVTSVFAKSSTENEATQKAAHLLDRLTFGPKPNEIAELAKTGDAGLQKWIDTQLNSKSISDADVTQKLKIFPSLGMSNTELSEKYAKQNKKNKKNKMEVSEDELPKQILVELSTQKLVRAVESKRQLQEVLVDFWFNHFNVDFNKAMTKWLITSYERDVIRPNVLGKFGDLLKAVAHSPAMLFYLDNHESVKNGFMPKVGPKKKNKDKPMMPKGLNENYARELMELHTLGVDGGYTQKDVIEVARLLTGWTIDRQEGTFKFRKQAHDEGAKTVLGVAYPAGGGEEEGNRLLDFLAKQPATAKFISRKLAVHFVSDNPSPVLIDKLSKVFLSTDGDLTAVYRELFKSPEFWASENRNVKIKTPFHLIASIGRALDAKVTIESHKDLKKIEGALGQMGQSIYRCQPPTGFKDTADFWVNPGSLVIRINTALAIANQRVPGISFDMGVFRSQLRSNNVSEVNKDALVYLDRWITGGSLGEKTVEKIAYELDQDPKILDEYDSKKKKKPEASVNAAKLLGLLLGSPEFQRY